MQRLLLTLFLVSFRLSASTIDYDAYAQYDLSRMQENDQELQDFKNSGVPIASKLIWQKNINSIKDRFYVMPTMAAVSIQMQASSRAIKISVLNFLYCFGLSLSTLNKGPWLPFQMYFLFKVESIKTNANCRWEFFNQAGVLVNFRISDK